MAVRGGGGGGGGSGGGGGVGPFLIKFGGGGWQQGKTDNSCYTYLPFGGRF
jgi:hypothetical protein